ncbi:MAG: hypothetical protein ABI634_11340 [Acidobacteriota bacterium]
MILSGDAYERWRADETWSALARLSPGESLALGMALWTSAVAVAVTVVPEARHQNYARQLGIADDRLKACRTPPRQ